MKAQRLSTRIFPRTCQANVIAWATLTESLFINITSTVPTARPDREPNIGLSQLQGVVRSIVDNAFFSALGLQLANLAGARLEVHLGNDGRYDGTYRAYFAS